MALNKFAEISENEIKSKGVQALADRPNKVSQYGQSGLSAADLKKWFDNLADLLRKKINEDHAIFALEDATKFIAYLKSIKYEDFHSIKSAEDIESLADLIISMRNGIFADKVLEVSSTLDSNPKSLTWCINRIDQILNRKAEFQGPNNDVLIVSDDPENYEYIDGNPSLDLETNKPKIIFEPRAAINTNFADARYGSKISASYDNSNGKLKIELKDYADKKVIDSNEKDLTNLKVSDTPTNNQNAINTNFADTRYAREIHTSYNNQDGTLTVSLLGKNESGATKELSKQTIDLPLESSIVEIDEVEEDGKLYLELTLASGNTTLIELDDLFRGFVKSVSDKNILYGTDAEGNQIKYYANSYDDDNHIPPKEPWSNIIPTKEFVKARNPTYQHGFAPTREQYEKKDMKGWYRIAAKTPTASGEGHAGNLFKVHCYIYGAGDCDIVFLVDQAEWNTKYVAISVLSYSYRTAKVITDIRVAYPNKDHKNDTLAYIDVYVNVNPTAKGFDSGRAIMFRTEELFYNSTRSWVPTQPRIVRDFAKIEPEEDVYVDKNGVLVDTKPLPSGNTSNGAYLNYGYHAFSTKSAVDHAWSDVTLPTSYINSLPELLGGVEEQLNVINDGGLI